MALTKCSRCGESFHLKLVSTNAAQALMEMEDSKEVICIGCFKVLNEYDVIEIVATNSDVPNAEIGDQGTILMVHGDCVAFEVECVLKDGSNKWIGTFTREQLKWLGTPTNG